jgi:hypothetical protein
MHINIKEILLSIMAVVIVSSMVGVVYARTDRPVQNAYPIIKCPIEPVCPPNPWCPPGGNHTDLKIKDQNEPWGDNVKSTWTITNMTPGIEYPFVGSFVGLKSNVKGNIEISCDYTVKEEFPICEPDSDHFTYLHPINMANQIIITQALYRNTSWQIDLLTGETCGMTTRDRRSYTDGRSYRWKIPDADRDGRITFSDLKHLPVNGLPLPSSSGEGARYVMSVRFASTANNNLQGDIFNLTMLYSFKPW